MIFLRQLSFRVENQSEQRPCRMGMTEEKLIAESCEPFFMTKEVELTCAGILFDHTMLH
jgi:hypothetical protein